MKDDNIMISTVINNKYTITRKLKTGGFGSVYLAKDNNKQQFAIKIIPQKYERYANIEFQMYQHFKTQKYSQGFIKQFEYGKTNDKLYLVMELLGSDLEEIMYKMKGSKISSKSALMIGLQLIDRLEALHKIGYIHRDIKPDNLAIGLKQKNKLIYLFDFGLAKKIDEPIEPQEKGKVIGTLGYMSVRSHEGKLTGILDDLESFVYTLVCLIHGSLPWMKINVQSKNDFSKIKVMKQNLSKKWFISNCIPVELFQILAYVRSLTNQDEVDYLKIKYKLINGLKALNAENDFAFDWCYDKKFKAKINSPRKKQKEQIAKMNESNQKVVQNEIYEIYKFIQDDEKKLKSPKKPSPKKQVKKISPPKKNIETKKKQEQKRQIKRPMSTKQVRQDPKKELEKQLTMFDAMKVEGPKIVINRTALHKI